MDYRAALKSAFLAAASIAALETSQSAIAQGTSVSPENYMPDQNGINWLDTTPGELRASVSIGEPNSGLSYEEDVSIQRYHSWSYYLKISDVSPFTNVDIINVSLGNSSKSFIVNNFISPPIITPTIQDGSNVSFDLANNKYIYTDRDGTIVDFVLNNTPVNFAGFGGLIQWIGSSITKPDGEKIVLTYKFQPVFSGTASGFRLQSVKSNKGYSFKILYAANTMNASDMASVRLWHRRASVTMIGDGSDYCDVNAMSCASLANSWPTLTFDNQGSFYGMGWAWSNGSGFSSATDSAGVKKTFEWSGTGPVETFQMWTKLGNPPQTEQAYVGFPFYEELNNPPGPNDIFTSTNDLGTWSYDSVLSVGTPPLGWDPVYNPWVRGVRTDPANNTVMLAAGWPTLPNTPPAPPLVRDITDENGRRTNYLYDFGYRLSAVIPPEATIVNELPTAGYTGYEYDARGNKTRTTQYAKAGSGQPNIVTEAGFPASCTNTKTCNQPNWVRDAAGNQTDFAYDSNHGGVLSELKPAVAIGQPGATVSARPLSLTTYQQRYAWVKNASGTMVQAADPIWVKSTMTECQASPGSSSPVCDTTKQSTVTTYQYGATGTAESLLVKGVAVASGGTTLRTCYGYDIYHRKISSTEPNAALSTCP